MHFRSAIKSTNIDLRVSVPLGVYVPVTVQLTVALEGHWIPVVGAQPAPGAPGSRTKAYEMGLDSTVPTNYLPVARG